MAVNVRTGCFLYSDINSSEIEANVNLTVIKQVKLDLQSIFKGPSLYNSYCFTMQIKVC